MTINERPLGEQTTEAFEARQIGCETVERLGIYTGRQVEVRPGVWAVVPDADGNVICFPYLEHGVEVSTKYRKLPWESREDGTPRFWQREGGKRTFFNADVLDDPALSRESKPEPLIITEGEVDAATAIDCGFPFTVSVPDGAPPVPRGKQPDELEPLDPGAEQTGKFEFLWNNRQRLRDVRHFVIAVDSDPAGQRLAAELVRRLSAARCSFVTYPDEPVVMDRRHGKRPCKDLNEVRVHFGQTAVTQVLRSARPYPVRGIYRLSDYPDAPPLPTFETGWFTLDQHLKLFPGAFIVVTGIPGHGKSTWVLNLARNVYDLHGWRTALFSPEMAAVPHLRDKLRTIVRATAVRGSDGKPGLFVRHGRSGLDQRDGWINDAVVFIDDEPGQPGEQDLTLDWLLDRASDAVMRDGVRLLVIDPWNEIEHAKRKDESMTEYIGRSIRAIRRWAAPRQVAVIVVAHPTKEVGKEGKPRVPTLYDIDGSAHWYNKCDQGVVIYSDAPGAASIYVKKIRFDGTGCTGVVHFNFDRDTLAFEYLDERAAP